MEWNSFNRLTSLFESNTVPTGAKCPKLRSHCTVIMKQFYTTVGSIPADICKKKLFQMPKYRLKFYNNII